MVKEKGLTGPIYTIYSISTTYTIYANVYKYIPIHNNAIVANKGAGGRPA